MKILWPLFSTSVLMLCGCAMHSVSPTDWETARMQREADIKSEVAGHFPEKSAQQTVSPQVANFSEVGTASLSTERVATEEGKASVELVSFDESPKTLPEPSQGDPAVREEMPIPLPAVVEPEQEPAEDQFSIRQQVDLQTVIASVYAFYPMLESAQFQRNIASGEQLSAWGAYDTKLKAASKNTVEGFYDNYRQKIGLEQQLYGGTQVFGGYRIGRGSFEPWYRERETNEGGEFKAGVNVPLAQDRFIDPARAELWKTTHGRKLVEADIQAQLIGFIQEATYAYWEWVAAGEKLKIAQRVLELAESRSDRIRSQVEEGFIDPPELVDNLRLVSERRANIAEAEQKLNQSAIKLSLFLRDSTGNPMIPSSDNMPSFPEPLRFDPLSTEADAQLALDQRPEMTVLEFQRRQISVDLKSAQNDLRPTVDTQIIASKDMGMPTSAKNDKGPLVLEAALFVDVPLQRRKAAGKIRSVQGKLMQNQAKRRMTADKIVSEVQSAYNAVMATFELVQNTRQAVEYAEELAERERTNNEEGASDLLKVTLREQYAAEASQKSVDALLKHFKAIADHRAAMAQDTLF